MKISIYVIKYLIFFNKVCLCVYINVSILENSFLFVIMWWNIQYSRLFVKVGVWYGINMVKYYVIIKMKG